MNASVPMIKTPQDVHINVQLPELSVEDVGNTALSFLQAVTDHIINGYAWIPVAIIIISAVAGATINRITQPKLIIIIDQWNLSFRLKKGLKNITRLLWPLVSLILISLAHAAILKIAPQVNTTIMPATSKLLVAWIFIRIFSQLIDNSLVRQSVSMTAWLVASISILNITDDVVHALDAIGMNFGSFRLSVYTVIKFIFALFILLTMTSLLSKAAERNLYKYSDLNPSARVLLLKTIKILLITLAILIGLTGAGIDFSALAIFGGALGLGIGFGLQKVVSNLFSGMLLLMDKSIKPGDIIELPGNSEGFGWVGQLGARYVSITTRDNKEYLIPNEDFITQQVINWSYTNRLIRVETKFRISYESDPHLVKKLAEEVTLTIDRVKPEPRPLCHLIEFGESSMIFILRWWISDPENGIDNTKGAIMLALWDKFREHHIKIPFPHRVLLHEDPMKGPGMYDDKPKKFEQLDF